MFKRSAKSILRQVLRPGSRYSTLRRRAFTINAARDPGFQSQCGQDWFALNYFGKAEPRVFLDIGAHDGVSYSNTFSLEKNFGWTGVCVEPNPDVFQRLRENRKCHCVNAAIGAEPGRAKFTKLTGYGEMLSGLAVKEDSVAAAIALHGAKREEIEVDVRTVADIVADVGVPRIDFLSIDTEGFEFNILQTVDFDRLQVQLIAVENNFADDRIEMFLRPKGFKLLAILDSDLLCGRA